MEDNKHNHSNENKHASKAPYLSKRGQYNPTLKQQQANTLGDTYLEQNIQAPPTGVQSPYHAGQQGQPPYTGAYGQQQPVTQGPLKHSGLGISSFIISLVSIAISILCIVLFIAGTANIINADPSQLDAMQDPAYVTEMIEGGSMPGGIGMIMVGVVLIFLSMGASFIGAILGLIAVFQKNRKKVFSILGLIFNALVFIGFILLFILGLFAGAGL